MYSAGNCRLRFSGVYLCWALAILSRPAMSWNVTCFVEENKEDKEWFLAWPRKKVPHTYDAHLSDVLSYLVHLQVIHEARRRLASKRKWKITRMKQKKKDYRRQATLIFLSQHVTLRLHVYVARGWPQFPFFAKFLVTGKINSYNDNQRLERNRFFVSVSPRSSPLGTFREEKRLRLSDRNSILIT